MNDANVKKLKPTRVAKLALVFLLLSDSVHSVSLRPPEAPIECPTHEVVNDVVCAADELKAGAFQIEMKFMSALVSGNPINAIKAKRSWRSKYLECGFLIGHSKEMRECIKSTFDSFEHQLLEIGTFNSNQENRISLLDEAISKLELIESKARMTRKECLHKNATTLDDGVSSARDIAVVVAKNCRSETFNYSNAMAATIEVSLPLFSAKSIPSQDSIQSLVNELSNPDDLIGFILEIRAAEKSEGQSARRQKARKKNQEFSF